MRKVFTLKKFVLLAAVVMLAIAMTGCGGDSSDSGGSNKKKSSKAEFNIGETWEVPGNWKLTITGVNATDDRNEFSDKNPGAVYLVDYTYENIGYKDSTGIMEGLYIGLNDGIVDAKGKMGYSYPGDTSSYPQETPDGATCDAQECIGVENAGDFKIKVVMYDSKGKKQTATFNIKVK